jgi:hypothetical protein
MNLLDFTQDLNVSDIHSGFSNTRAGWVCHHHCVCRVGGKGGETELPSIDGELLSLIERPTPQGGMER